MNFTQDTDESSTQIHSYTDEYFVINQTKYNCHCQLHRDGLIDRWQPLDVNHLQFSDFDTLLACKPEVILLGTGSHLIFPAATLRQQFIQHNIGLEIMDTGGACRTYNLLLSEGRNVAAAILLTDSRL
ncbi:MAG: Mth938-like domain-containing protein [Gammaproteobacteria bacterium]|nr:Mth938-like domain-containing protein [Gammaproteobacteria bacterium]